ncbi:acylneuraminate cytidylyltransferase [Clostridia bacterium]|nr:acylneuraminate cytidylyltransferase [Clostridia bacterium]
MRTIAFIPVRGGSKSIPLKNVKIFAGKPLIYWTAKAASDCEFIDEVCIATDSDTIAEMVNNLQLPKVSVIGRSVDSATDTASTESAMLEFAERHDFDNIVLIQATSPLLTAEDLNGGFSLFECENTDSVLSVVRQKRFHWQVGENGVATPTNYDHLNRPRRQEFDGYLVENGAFYITIREKLLETRCRISGNILAYEMPEESYFEIDEPSDWIIVENLLKKRHKKSTQIKLVATDCDGVLTDGGMYYSENGDELKRFNAKDGHGFKLLRDVGIKTAIISGERSTILERRAKKLKVNNLIMGEQDKLGALTKLCGEYGIDISEAAYIGDDVFDIPALESCGMGCAPADALDSVKDAASYVSRVSGGKGVFRDVAEIILLEDEI